jgi:DHA1 family inner membrane transport protein
MRFNFNNKETLYIFILTAIQFAHIVDFVIMMPLGPSLMQSLGITPAQFGSLVSSYNFSAAIAALLLSSFVSRFERKQILMLTMAGFVVGTLVCGVVSGFHELLTARIVTGIFGGIVNSIVFTMATDLIPYQRRGKAVGILMSSFPIASILGVPIGLWISDIYGWRSAFFFIVAISLLIMLLAYLVLPNVKTDRGANKKSVLDDYMSVIKNKLYLQAYFFIFIAAFSMFLLIPFLAPFAVQNIKIATTDLKYMYIYGGIFTVITARIIGVYTDKKGAAPMFVLLVIASSLPILAYAHAGPMSLASYLVLSTAFMSLISGRMIPCMTFISDFPTEADRGGFMGIINAVRSFGSAAATGIGGMMLSQNLEGEIVGFNHVCYFAIAISVGILFYMKIIKASKEKAAI